MRILVVMSNPADGRHAPFNVAVQVAQPNGAHANGAHATTAVRAVP
jgi:hypothetical protein